MTKERFETYLQDVSYCDWEVKVQMDGDRPYLQVGFWETCVMHPEKGLEYQTGRKWMLSPHMTKSEVIQTAFKAVMTAVEHEVREKFTYKGKNIFGPHFNVDTLVDMCESEAYDLRAPIPANQSEAAA